MVVKRKSTKNPPMLSHEFVIQNHADIVACVAMVFVVGLMFQVSSPLASLFIALHHNVSVPMEVLPGQIQDVVHYTAGAKASFSLKLNNIHNLCCALVLIPRRINNMQCLHWLFIYFFLFSDPQIPREKTNSPSSLPPTRALPSYIY